MIIFPNLPTWGSHPLQEIYYFVAEGDKVRSDDITAETSEVQIRDSDNQELGEALIGDDGIMAAGLQPATRAATEAGEKALIESLAGATEKKKTKAKEEKTEKAEPKTFDEPLVLHSKINNSGYLF